MRTLIIGMLVALAFQTKAQTVDVNPNIQWSYVRTQNLELQSGRTYQFEVPAERGYDYVFNVAHETENSFVRVALLDLQYKPISAMVDSSNTASMDLNFRVDDNGTYIVVVVLSAEQGADATLPSVLSLVRRPIVEY